MIYLLTIAVILGVWVAPYSPKLYKEAPLVTTEASAPIVEVTPTPSKPEMAYELAKGFEKYGTDVMNQSFNVAKNESGWRHDAMGWNCRYDGKSQACKPQDRKNAWSVDCGLMQINVRGTECPKELFDIKVNISKAVAMYERRSWSPWVAAKNLGYVK